MSDVRAVLLVVLAEKEGDGVCVVEKLNFHFESSAKWHAGLKQDGLLS